MTTSSTTNDNECQIEWKQNGSDFRFREGNNYGMYKYSATSFWKYNVKQNIYRSSHRSSSIKKAALKNFAEFTWKQLKVFNFIKKRLQHKCFSLNTFLEEDLWTAAFASVFDKNKRCLCGSENLPKTGLKILWIGPVLFKYIWWCKYVFIFKETSDWLLPKWVWIINKSI